MNEREISSLNEDVKDRWNRVADFWNERMGDDGNSFHRVLVTPSQERLLDLKRDELVVEVACGNGQFTRRMAEAGDLLGIRLLDHMILGAGGKWVSLSRRGAW